MPTSVRLPEEIEARLDFLAQQTGRTKAFYIREMILDKLDDLEDYYLAADVLEKVRRGRETLHSLDDVEKELGLAG